MANSTDMAYRRDIQKEVLLSEDGYAEAKSNGYYLA